VKTKLKYRRVMLKLSGELFGNAQGQGINLTAFNDFAAKLVKIWKNTGVELCIVVGGGNIFRGRSKPEDMDQVSADYMGMLATIINGIALQEALERAGAPTRMMTAFEIKAVAEPFIWRRALRHLSKGRIVILTAGTGSPYFSTDSGAVLRAVELNCQAVIKATNVDGVYTADPKINKHATLIPHLTFQTALEKNLGILDATAFAMAQKQKLPIIVFNVAKIHDLAAVLRGKPYGTIIE
jgi:uridylate kinase